MVFSNTHFCLIARAHIGCAFKAIAKQDCLKNNSRMIKVQPVRSVKTGGYSKCSFAKDLSGEKNINETVVQFSGKNLSVARLWKPFTFTIAFSAGAFCSCAIWQYENVRKQAVRGFKINDLWNREVPFWQTKRFTWRDQLNKKWNSMSEGERLFYKIFLINVLVHIGWKVPKFQRAMLRYFTNGPTNSGLCWPLVLSTFSHFSTIHLMMNMYALHGFSTLAVTYLGKEQFLALYLSGGVVSSFVSLFYRTLLRKPQVSVGASGAILAIIGYICSKEPNLELSIVLLPIMTFSAASALKGFLIFDTIGLISRWKIIDHAAHLGGTCSGILYFHWGNSNIWQKRDYVLRWWHKIRKSIA